MIAARHINSISRCSILPFAGHVKAMAMDEWAHVALVAALAHTDDTALLAKVVLPEVMVSCRMDCHSRQPCAC